MKKIILLLILCAGYMVSHAQAKWDPTSGQWIGYNAAVGLGPGTLSGNWYNGGSYLMPGTLTPMPNRNQNWNQGWGNQWGNSYPIQPQPMPVQWGNQWGGNPMTNYNPQMGGFMNPWGGVTIATPPINGYINPSWGNQWGNSGWNRPGGNVFFNIGASFGL